MRPGDEGSGAAAAMCSINIAEMGQLVSASETARSEGQWALEQVKKSYSDYDVHGAAQLSPVGSALDWIGQELVGLRRRLSMAQALNASTPGMGNFVQFDENKLSQATPAQARADARAAAKYLRDNDPAMLKIYLEDGAYDPYFAAEFAKSVSPRELGDFIAAQASPYEEGKLMPGVDADDYDAVLSGLGQTLGQATRNTGDLELPPGLADEWIQAMVSPPYESTGNETEDWARNDQDLANRAGLLMVLSRGQWSTEFLQSATNRFWEYDKTFDTNGWRYNYMGAGTQSILPNGKPLDDGMVALMAALSHNPEAAKWAFTQGGTEDVPLGGEQVPINAFMHWMLTKHRFLDEEGGPAAVVNAMAVATIGDKMSPVALDAKSLGDSAAEQKAEWDAKPWYEKWGHTILDAISVLPVVGIPADLVSTGWYSLEGDLANAGLSLAGVVPIVGDAATGGKVLKAFGKSAELTKALSRTDLAGKSLDDALESAQLLRGAEAYEGAIFKFDNLEDFQKAANTPHPNVIYEFDGIRYTTDSNVPPRSIKIEGKPLTTKGFNDPKLRTLLGKGPDAQPGDVGFHLWAESFGGPTNALNVINGNGKVAKADIARFKNLNTSEYAKMENQVRAALKRGDDVHFEVKPIYRGISKRPAQIKTTVTLNGERRYFKFENTPQKR